MPQEHKRDLGRVTVLVISLSAFAKRDWVAPRPIIREKVRFGGWGKWIPFCLGWSV